MFPDNFWITFIVVTCCVLVYYTHYCIARYRKGEGVGPSSTLLDGLILITIVGIFADGAAYGSVAVTGAIALVATVAVLRTIDRTVHWAVTRWFRSDNPDGPAPPRDRHTTAGQ